MSAAFAVTVINALGRGLHLLLFLLIGHLYGADNVTDTVFFCTHP